MVNLRVPFLTVCVETEELDDCPNGESYIPGQERISWKDDVDIELPEFVQVDYFNAHKRQVYCCVEDSYGYDSNVLIFAEFIVVSLGDIDSY